MLERSEPNLKMNTGRVTLIILSPLIARNSSNLKFLYKNYTMQLINAILYFREGN